ncbi:adenine-specific methyltransferase EcoRI family protein [Bifidobacterium castoris]|uniref:Restriction endonuclease subunit M n=1 Tax=Bifidobacterium castoris TaxID=2306972 RepID=A0A430FAP6_9BIFI|nr:adenine-specific methyltransferase EcoRI family protein [Bifidobacterium castoris]RSX49872.1 restriction endonuclease subunit M [Bifidobacterium castoris]
MSRIDLGFAQRRGDDEFHTPAGTAEPMLQRYADRLRGAHVLLNTNDGDTSAFWTILCERFTQWGLRSLTSLRFDPSADTLFADADGGGRVFRYDGRHVSCEPTGDAGGFDSPSGLRELTAADVVVGNPPFSRLKDYVPRLVASRTGFLIIANPMCLAYRSVFPLFRAGLLRCTGGNGGLWFRHPSGDVDACATRRDVDGCQLVRVSPCGWLTNLPGPMEGDVFDPEPGDPSMLPLLDDPAVPVADRRALIPGGHDGMVAASVGVFTMWPRGWRPVAVSGAEGWPAARVHGRKAYKRILLEPCPGWVPGMGVPRRAG